MRVLDKLDKVGPDGVRAMLDLADSLVDKLLQLVQTPLEEVPGLGVSHELLDEGLEELRFVIQEAGGVAVADMGVVRGFDYYTGTVYESVMQGHESLGAVCSGGRYDNLAAGAREPLPGVGISIGVSRIMGRLLGQGLLPAARKTPTVVLVAQVETDSSSVVRALRSRGVPAEAYHEPAKLGKQLKYASDKGIPWVWLPFEDGHVVRDMASGAQAPAEAGSWTPA
jgi:histidyl-tRNA synthetase